MKLIGGRLLEEVVNEITQHSILVANGVSILSNIVKNYVEYDFDQLNRAYLELDKLEEQGDEIKRKLMNILKTSHLHPEDREDLLRLVLTIDEVIGLSKAVAKKFVIFKHLSITIPTSIHEYFVKIIDKTHEAAKCIRELVQSLQVEDTKTLELAERVERLEEEVDDLRSATLRELYKHCTSRCEIICISLPIVLDDIESITDKCEEVADMYRLHIISR